MVPIQYIVAAQPSLKLFLMSHYNPPPPYKSPSVSWRIILSLPPTAWRGWGDPSCDFTSQMETQTWTDSGDDISHISHSALKRMQYVTLSPRGQDLCYISFHSLINSVRKLKGIWNTETAWAKPFPSSTSLWNATEIYLYRQYFNLYSQITTVTREIIYMNSFIIITRMKSFHDRISE